ncbi:MAG: hypothetical protein M1269_08025 [Chloroflexi bacterium]|nr:hypothetical protein [Chloroflexota bacterium]
MVRSTVAPISTEAFDLPKKKSAIVERPSAIELPTALAPLTIAPGIEFNVFVTVWPVLVLPVIELTTLPIPLLIPFPTVDAAFDTVLTAVLTALVTALPAAELATVLTAWDTTLLTAFAAVETFSLAQSITP